jgi:small subunit ribosomal protein S17
MSDQQNDRNARRVIQGVVTSEKMAQTITVTVERRSRHLKYQKYIRKHSRVYAHDEKGEAHKGDKVEIMECRPISKLKRWRLIRVLERSVIPDAIHGGGAS